MNLPPFPRRALFAALRVLMVSALVSLSAHAAEEAKRSYNVPAADAAVALRQFSETSGKEVLFMVDGRVDAFVDDVMACGARGISRQRRG
jgi:hypothetical protein